MWTRPIGYGGHAGRQIQRDFSVVPQVSEKGSERRYQEFGAPRAEPMSVTLHKPRDIGGTERGKIQSLVTKSFGKELLYEMHIVLQRPHGQPPLL